MKKKPVIASWEYEKRFPLGISIHKDFNGNTWNVNVGGKLVWLDEAYVHHSCFKEWEEAMDFANELKDTMIERALRGLIQ